MAKKIKFINYEDYFDENNLITDAEGFNKKNKDVEFSDQGIYSTKIFGDYYAENNDIEKKGWIKLNYPLINPLYYLMLKQKKLIKDSDNIMELIRILSDEDSTELTTFFNERKTNSNGNLISFILENKEYAIIKYFPVFSHKLRPVKVIPGTKPTLVYDKINNYFSFLIEYNNIIGDSMSSKNYDNKEFIEAMQEKINTIVEFIIVNMLSGKNGIFRKEVLGMRINFSGRCVITPLTGDYEIDDVSMPYVVACELYKYQILNLLTKIKGINYNEALRIHEMALIKYDHEVYSIMMSLLKNTKGGLKILLNRKKIAA